MKASTLLEIVTTATRANPLHGPFPALSHEWLHSQPTWLGTATAVWSAYQHVSAGAPSCAQHVVVEDASDLMRTHLWYSSHLPTQWLLGPDDDIARQDHDESLRRLTTLQKQQRRCPAVLVSLLDPVLRTLARIAQPAAAQSVQLYWLPGASLITRETYLTAVCEVTTRAVSDWYRLSADRLLANAAQDDRLQLQRFRQGMAAMTVALAYRHIEMQTVTHVMRARTITGVVERCDAMERLLTRWTAALHEHLSRVKIATEPLEQQALEWVGLRLDAPLKLTGGTPQVAPVLLPTLDVKRPDAEPRKLSSLTLRAFEQDLSTMIGAASSPALQLGRLIALFKHGLPVPRVALLSGTTGSGKSFALQAIQMAYEVTFAERLVTLSIDAGRLRPAGWHGTGVVDIQEQMIAAMNGSTERGLLILDAFHTNAPGREAFIASEDDRSHRTKAMRDLVGIFDGQVAVVSRTGKQQEATATLDTARWFVVVVGAFESPHGTPTCKTLTDLGYPAELVDRIAHIAHLPPIAETVLVPIIRNALQDLGQRYAAQDLMIFHDNDLEAHIARKAMQRDLPLRQILHLVTELYAAVAIRMLTDGTTIARLGTHDDVLPALTNHATHLWAGG